MMFTCFFFLTCTVVVAQVPTAQCGINVFLDLLQQNTIILNHGANERTVGLIVKDRYLHAEMLNCANPSDAFAIYSKALLVLSSHSKEELAQSSNQDLLIAGRVELNGPVS